MKYFVRIGGEEHEVVLDADGVTSTATTSPRASRRSTARRSAW